MPNPTAAIQQRAPEFDVVFQSPYPLFYFNHVIDGEAATLKVEVLGPNLSHTFCHTRASQLLPASSVKNTLQRKTTGFLALIDSTEKRIVLAWSESGHGHGNNGDFLDARPGTLSNATWTRRVVNLGRVLGVNMARPFDKGRSQRTARESEGLYLGSHVELKLAVHGICTLLCIFGISSSFDVVTQQQLRSLRRARWDDGSRPVFELYFSRKNCHGCLNFINKLQEATGVTIRLVWKDRLERVVYQKNNLDTNPSRRTTQQDQTVEEIVEIEDEDGDFGNDAGALDDAQSDSSNETVGDGYDGSTGVIDLTMMNESHSPNPRAGTHPADKYLDGLAYCVGQLEELPQGAQTAIIELAASMRRRGGDREVIGSRLQALRIHSSVNKPLPATPVIEDPSLGHQNGIVGQQQDKTEAAIASGPPQDCRQHPRRLQRNRSMSPTTGLDKRQPHLVRSRSPRLYYQSKGEKAVKVSYARWKGAG